MNNKLLRIYLNDHLAGAAAGIELVKRTAKNNQDNTFGPKLNALYAEIEADRAALRRIMDDLGLSEDVLKQKAAFVAEKFGRLKLNGQLTGYSPLSRLVEIEGLLIGVFGKLAAWKLLERLSDELPLEISEITVLIERAEDQLERLTEMRLEAGAIAMASPEDTSSR